jgi:hypothetical protein
VRLIAVTALCALLAACGTATGSATTTDLGPSAPGPVVRIALVGDVMLGRGVAPVIASDAGSVFEDVRHLLAAADIAGANLESPLTTRPHVSDNVNALEADPDSATALAGAGFDLVALPNNHTMDAGAAGLLDTIGALDGAGIEHVGAGANAADAAVPAIFEANGLSVGFLAFDTTGVGPAAGTEAGVTRWEGDASLDEVAKLRERVDVLVVSIDGGTEYLPVTDPGLAEIAAELADSGVDIVWGHGAHVTQPVSLTQARRPTVIATSLGNFLFDQVGTDRTTGYMLEVLAGADGVVAYRVGVTEHPDRRVDFDEWLDPAGDAVWLDDSWWSLTTTRPLSPTTVTDIEDFRHGDLVTAGQGDINNDGTDEIIASFRRPFETTPFMETHPEMQWEDAEGRSAHVGVYQPDGLVEIWVAGTVMQPVAGLEVCDGSLAVVHDQLDDPSLVATSAWVWNGFGFTTSPTIPGGGTPACADVDGDGRTEPVILDR